MWRVHVGMQLALQSRFMLTESISCRHACSCVLCPALGFGVGPLHMHVQVGHAASHQGAPSAAWPLPC